MELQYINIKSLSKTTNEIEFGKDLDILASLRLLTKLINDEADKLQIKLQRRVIDEFIIESEYDHPTHTFKGFGDYSQASCEIKRKPYNYSLDEDLVSLLNEYDISFDEREIVSERYVINPDCTNEDFIKLNELIKREFNSKSILLKEEKQTINIVNDKTIDDIMNLNNKLLIKSLLLKVSNIAIGKFFIKGKLLFNKDHSMNYDVKQIILNTLNKTNLLK
jgi:hypothetical protein